MFSLKRDQHHEKFSSKGDLHNEQVFFFERRYNHHEKVSLKGLTWSTVLFKRLLRHNINFLIHDDNDDDDVDDDDDDDDDSLILPNWAGGGGGGAPLLQMRKVFVNETYEL